MPTLPPLSSSWNESRLTDIARAATGRHHRSTASVSALAVPPAPQHTSMLQHRHSRSQDSLVAAMTPSTGGSADSDVITIEFDGGAHVVVRPNRIIRGRVILDSVGRMYVTRIRVKFRAEESASVRVEEGGGEIKASERLHQVVTTFFETDWKLWGNDVSAYSQSAWEDLEAGHYEFPFALKFPNVNYPPSMEEPKGFGVRFIWSVAIDGPGLQSGLKSREYITPYRPIIVSSPDKEWTYRTTLMREKKHPLAEAKVKLQKQTYCPDDPFSMQLSLSVLRSDAKVVYIRYKFRKHHQGRMLVQSGTAFRTDIRTVLEGSLSLESHSSVVSETIEFGVPTRLVSPSFSTRHTRVHYDILVEVTLEYGMFKTSHNTDFSIPITIANLPFDHLTRIPDLTSISHYTESRDCPAFFDPGLDEPPPESTWPNELIGPLTAALVGNSATTPAGEEPPNYFSLPTLPPQLEIRKERKERTVYLSSSTRNANDIPAAKVIDGLFDEAW